MRCTKCNRLLNPPSWALPCMCPKILVVKPEAKEIVRVSYYCQLKTRKHLEALLGTHAWRIWQDIKQHAECDFRCPGSVHIRNYSSKVSAHSDGHCCYRFAANLATGEVVNGGYLLTGESAINENPVRVAALDLSTLPANMAAIVLQFGAKGTTTGTCSLDVEVPPERLGIIDVDVLKQLGINVRVWG